jgi:hypothetical protein
MRLTQCDAEHVGLTRNVEWNPVLPEGLLSQLHAANLLGSLEVIMAHILIDCKELTPVTLKQVPWVLTLCCCPSYILFAVHFVQRKNV